MKGGYRPHMHAEVVSEGEELQVEGKAVGTKHPEGDHPLNDPSPPSGRLLEPPSSQAQTCQPSEPVVNEHAEEPATTRLYRC